MSKEEELIKFKNYKKSIWEAIGGIKKEICLKGFVLSSNDLECVVKSSKNCEELKICQSEVHCTDKLSFDTGSEYQIKLLSFSKWGMLEETQWRKDSSYFENIIVAIKNSGLKDSLKTIDIEEWCLKRKEVRNVLDKHGLENIKVANKSSK